ITPEQVIELKALMGDKSDNIPGVPGVGQKTATKLLKQYETLENLYEHVEEVSGKKLKENLTNHKEDAFMSRELATINQSAPVEIEIDDVAYEGIQEDEVRDMFLELGFQSLLNRIDDEEEQQEEKELESISYEVIDVVTKDILADKSAFHMEILGD